jgi:hypothetical protein
VHILKKDIVRIAEICEIVEDIHVIALYYIERNHRQGVINLSQQVITLSRNIRDECITELYVVTLPTYSTEELQSMMMVWVMLMFKIADLMGYEYRNTSLKSCLVTTINDFLLLSGPRRILLLECSDDVDSRRREFELFRKFAFPNMWREIAKILNDRGEGLLRVPTRQISAFIQEIRTSLPVDEWGPHMENELLQVMEELVEENQA